MSTRNVGIISAFTRRSNSNHDGNGSEAEVSLAERNDDGNSGNQDEGNDDIVRQLEEQIIHLKIELADTKCSKDFVELELSNLRAAFNEMKREKEEMAGELELLRSQTSQGNGQLGQQHRVEAEPSEIVRSRGAHRNSQMSDGSDELDGLDSVAGGASSPPTGRTMDVETNIDDYQGHINRPPSCASGIAFLRGNISISSFVSNASNNQQSRQRLDPLTLRRPSDNDDEEGRERRSQRSRSEASGNGFVNHTLTVPTQRSTAVASSPASRGANMPQAPSCASAIALLYGGINLSSSSLSTMGSNFSLLMNASSTNLLSHISRRAGSGSVGNTGGGGAGAGGNGHRRHQTAPGPNGANAGGPGLRRAERPNPSQNEDWGDDALGARNPRSSTQGSNNMFQQYMRDDLPFHER